MLGMLSKFGLSAALPLAAAALAMEVSPVEHAANLSTIAAVATAVGIVVAGLSWLDRRIDGKIRAHSEIEQKLDDARHQATLAKMRQMLAEYAQQPQRRKF